MAAVISRGGELLVCQRPPHKRHGGLWEFPGGKTEPDESDESAARRELREELGVSVVSAEVAEFEAHDPGSLRPLRTLRVLCVKGTKVLSASKPRMRH